MISTRRYVLFIVLVAATPVKRLKPPDYVNNLRALTFISKSVVLQVPKERLLFHELHGNYSLRNRVFFVFSGVQVCANVKAWGKRGMFHFCAESGDYMRTFNVTEFAKCIGVSVKTLQRWDREGRLKPLRSPSNRRMYTHEHLAEAFQLKSSTPKRTVVYLRVADPSGRFDLVSQRTALESFCAARGLTVDEWMVEIGDGLNYARPKLLELVEAIMGGEVQVLVTAHQDRLARFGSELIEYICRLHGCELLVLNAESHSPNQELMQDLQTIVHRYSTRFPGLKKYRDVLSRALHEETQPVA